MSKPRLDDFRYQLLATGALFFGLFLIEYPPIFLLGYWSWSGYAHKTISGAIIVINLFITQYMVRRWGFFRQSPKAHGQPDQRLVDGDSQESDGAAPRRTQSSD